VGVEWAERIEPDESRSARFWTTPDAVPAGDGKDLPTAADHEQDVAADTGQERHESEQERRASEYRRYRNLVDRVYAAARGAAGFGPAAAESTPPDTAVAERTVPDSAAPDRTPRDGAGQSQDRWRTAMPILITTWEEIEARYGYGRDEGDDKARASARAADGGWQGTGGRRLDAVDNAEVDKGYARIREAGERFIVPALRAVEAEDPGRKLVGFEHRFKGPDRLKEKVAERMLAGGHSVAASLARVFDVVRFTFEYTEADYTAGVLRDTERLAAQGFTHLERRNTWESEQYKGINARWREPESGVTFEVQFHTRASREAKELTHQAYERIRSITEQMPDAEREKSELEEFQRRVNSAIPIPPGVASIDNFQREGTDGR
jgi:hypothetical protein